MAGRIYVVENDNELSLVRAVSPAQAINHMVKETYKVRLASVDDVAEYMAQGATVEDSTLKVGNMEIPSPELGEGPAADDVQQ